MSEQTPEEGSSNEEVTPVDEAHDSGDALSQAEAILNEVGTEVEEDAPANEKETELRNDLLRLQAEYVNYRRRVERDRDVAREVAVQSVFNNLLPVLDDIDAARAHGDLTDGPFAAIANKLDSVLEGLGLERIADAGVEFDPNIHEALLQQPHAEIPADHVAQVLRTGFKKGDRILRAAQVIVSLGE